MAVVTWKTRNTGEVKSNNGKETFKITIKKSPGGLSYTLLNSDKVVIKSGAEISELQLFAREYYRYI